MPIPAVTADEMREIDRLAVETYGIHLLQMMENAGRALALLAQRMLGGDVAARRIVVAAGRGNNGGGGLAAARHLANWGGRISVMVERVDGLSGVPAQQFRGAVAAGASVAEDHAAFDVIARGADLLLDALIGYGLRGDPRGWVAEIIRRANTAAIPLLALDVPSGLDATSGECHDPCIQAAATLTLALPKTGLLTPSGRAAAGVLYLTDIGIPPALYGYLGIAVARIFNGDPFVPLDQQGDPPALGQ